MTEGRTVPLTPPQEKGGGDASGSAYPPKKLRGDHQSLLPNVGGKSLAALRGMVPAGFAIPSGATKPHIAAFVTPVSDAGLLDSVSGANLRTCPPHVRYVVSLDGSCHSGSYSETSSFVRSSAADVPVVNIVVTTAVDADVTAGSTDKDVLKDFENIRDSTSAGGVNADATNISKLKKTSTSSDSFYASQSLDTKTMRCVYIPRWKVMNDSTIDDPYVCRDLMDRLAPPTLFAQLRSMDYDQLYSEFNVGAAWQVCLGAEVRMRAEHTLEKKGELESNQLSVMETADAAKSTEIRDLKEENFALEGERTALYERVTTLVSLLRDELNSKVASLEYERDCLAAQKSSLESAFELFMERIEALQDEQAKALGDKVAELDAQLPKDNVAFTETSMSSSLEVVNLRVQRFREEAKEKLLSLTDVTTPFVEPLSSKSLTGEANTSAAPITTLSTTFASTAIIPPSSVVSDQDQDAKPHSEDPPAVTFEKEELSTSPE
nr:hypothetical protein [Tanacetum cinerariifolium]